MIDYELELKATFICIRDDVKYMNCIAISLDVFFFTVFT